jgi:hypothetical protein
VPASYDNVDAYLNSLDAPRQGALQRLRCIIRETVPAAEETNSIAQVFLGLAIKRS